MVPVQTLSPRAWSAEAVESFAACCDVSPYGAIQTPLELVQGCGLFEFKQGRAHALIALMVNRCSGGTNVHVQAAASLDKARPLPLHAVMASIEQTAFALGGDRVTLATQHAALAARAPRWGWHIAGAVLARNVGGH